MCLHLLYQVVVLGVVWLSGPPLLIGLLFEAIFINPVRAHSHETPRYPLLQVTIECYGGRERQTVGGIASVRIMNE